MYEVVEVRKYIYVTDVGALHLEVLKESLVAVRWPSVDASHIVGSTYQGLHKPRADRICFDNLKFNLSQMLLNAALASPVANY